MKIASMAVVAAACLLLAGCGDTSAQEPEAGSAPVTERRAVSPDGVTLVSPTELVVDVSSCMGDPVVDELEEDDEQVGIRIVTTMVVSGDGPACADALTVTLNAPLDGRTVIDLVSGDTVPVEQLDTEPNPSASQTERGPVSLAGTHVQEVNPTELLVDIPSCRGDPVVEQVVEDDEQVRIQVVTTIVVSGEAPHCLDGVTVVLDASLDGRTVIDLVSGETLTVVELDTEPDPVGASPENLLERSFVSTSVMVDGEPLQLVGGPLAVRFDGHDGGRVDISWEAGCNIAGGKFDATAERLEPRRSPDGVAAFDLTEMGCEEQELQQDEWLQELFADGVTWELDGDTLLLSTDSVEMVFNEGPWRRG